MESATESLRSQGIHPYGTEPLLLQEQRVTRFIEREYQRLQQQPQTLESLGVSSSRGPMWEETDELISGHYDERIEFFTSFLDHDYRAYSMAYYGENGDAVRASSYSLEQAQEAKFRLICERIGIRGDERLLNIGCGFGSFEHYLFRRYPNLQVVGLTPSQVQTRFLQQCQKDPQNPLHGKDFEVLQLKFDGETVAGLGAASFDLVTSIGLLEQVLNMQELFEKFDYLLRPGGKTFHHFIVSRLVIPQFLDASKTLIGAYFPGGRIWPFEEFTRHTERLELVDSWFVNGMNYWRTLDEWHKRFWEGIDDLAGVLPAERIRHWNDYFYLCKVCFAPADGSLFGNGHYLFRKPG